MSAAPASFLTELQCSATGEALAMADSLRLLSLSPANKPIVARYDLERLAATRTRDDFRGRDGGMWRWRELLPLPAEGQVVSLGEGDTPLLSAPRLGKLLGIDELLIKEEGLNPTGSFKSRGMSAAVSMALHLGAEALITPSAGNAGGALAAYGARAGLPVEVCVPADTPEINRLEVPFFGARLETLNGLIDACGAWVKERRAETGAFDLSTLKEPYRLEGKKTMGLELAEQLGWQLPDVILYPTGGGTGLIGMHKAFDELEALGWLDSKRRPRFVSVQAEGCAPVVRAFDKGLDHAPKWENAQTQASGLRVPGAVGDFLMLRALRESEGTAVAVSEQSLLDWTLKGSECEGICFAPEGGACIAAAAQLRESGWIREGERVVVFNTGTGVKYLEVMRQLAARN